MCLVLLWLLLLVVSSVYVHFENFPNICRAGRVFLILIFADHTEIKAMIIPNVHIYTNMLGYRTWLWSHDWCLGNSISKWLSARIFRTKSTSSTIYIRSANDYWLKIMAHMEAMSWQFAHILRVTSLKHITCIWLDVGFCVFVSLLPHVRLTNVKICHMAWFATRVPFYCFGCFFFIGRRSFPTDMYTSRPIWKKKNEMMNEETKILPMVE